VDGVFDPKTQQAVMQYQHGIKVAANGIVDQATLYSLTKGEVVANTVPVSATTAATPVRQPTPLSAVLSWTLEQKFTMALRKTVPKLPANMQQEFAALLSPTSLAIIVGTLVVWAASHAFGVGEVIDLVLLLGGVIFLGMAVVDVAEELYDFLKLTCTAETEQDLDIAASHLAAAIAVIGVAAFAALLAKGTKMRSKSAKKPPLPEPKPLMKDPGKKIGAGESRPVESTATKPPVVAKSPKTLSKQETADWYKQQGEYFNDKKNLENHLEGTDFSKPVTLKRLPENTELIQYVRADGKPGMYFAKPGTPMETLGIKEPPPRIQRRFIVKKPIEVVESSAATLETELAPGVGGTGGGQQLIFPKGWESSVRSIP